MAAHDSKLGSKLILDELFDLSLYSALRDITQGKVQEMLGEMIRIEQEHYGFWQDFFQLKVSRLDLWRRLKLRLLALICRIFGEPAVHLVLEAIEVYGVRKYLSLWEAYKDGPLGAAVKGILQDEFQHEDAVVTGLMERKISPARIRNIFLGLNDGLVEMLGAVSGFFAALGDSLAVLLAATTTAVAGSLSMAAGVYVASSSEREVEKTEGGKKRFLGEEPPEAGTTDSPLGSAMLVGASYFFGALVPVLPVLFGARNALVSLIAAGSVILLVSLILAFLSGMEIKKRLLTNLVIIAAAVGVTYLIGTLVRTVWGVSL